MGLGSLLSGVSFALTGPSSGSVTDNEAQTSQPGILLMLNGAVATVSVEPRVSPFLHFDRESMLRTWQLLFRLF